MPQFSSRNYSLQASSTVGRRKSAKLGYLLLFLALISLVSRLVHSTYATWLAVTTFDCVPCSNLTINNNSSSPLFTSKEVFTRLMSTSKLDQVVSDKLKHRIKRTADLFDKDNSTGLVLRFGFNDTDFGAANRSIERIADDGKYLGSSGSRSEQILLNLTLESPANQTKNLSSGNDRQERRYKEAADKDHKFSANDVKEANGEAEEETNEGNERRKSGKWADKFGQETDNMKNGSDERETIDTIDSNDPKIDEYQQMDVGFIGVDTSITGKVNIGMDSVSSPETADSLTRASEFSSAEDAPANNQFDDESLERADTDNTLRRAELPRNVGPVGDLLANPTSFLAFNNTRVDLNDTKTCSDDCNRFLSVELSDPKNRRFAMILITALSYLYTLVMVCLFLGAALRFVDLLIISTFIEGAKLFVHFILFMIDVFNGVPIKFNLIDIRFDVEANGKGWAMDLTYSEYLLDIVVFVLAVVYTFSTLRTINNKDFAIEEH